MKNKIVMTIVSSFCFISYSNASNLSAKILSFSSDKSKILIQSQNLDVVNKGDIVTLNQDCNLEVVKKSNEKAILSTDLCEGNHAFLIKGKTIQLTVDNETESKKSFKNDRGSETINTAGNISTSHTKLNKFDADRTSRVSKGFRVGYTKSFLDAKAKFTENGFTDSKLLHMIVVGEISNT